MQCEHQRFRDRCPNQTEKFRQLRIRCQIDCPFLSQNHLSPFTRATHKRYCGRNMASSARHVVKGIGRTTKYLESVWSTSELLFGCIFITLRSPSKRDSVRLSSASTMRTNMIFLSSFPGLDIPLKILDLVGDPWRTTKQIQKHKITARLCKILASDWSREGQSQIQREPEVSIQVMISSRVLARSVPFEFDFRDWYFLSVII